MKGKNQISDGLVEKIRNWNHSGFSVHNDVVIGDNDREELVRLPHCVVHASFSLEKIRYVEKTKCVMYKSNPVKLRSPLQGGIRTLIIVINTQKAQIIHFKVLSFLK